MIYLIKSAGYKEEEGTNIPFFLLKIGYTEDSRKDIRFMQYKMHNPTYQILYTIPNATKDHEKRIQYKFRNLLFEDYGREWFKYSEEIINFFESIKDLEELSKLPKGNSSHTYSKYKNALKDILKYVSNISCDTLEFKKLCREICNILGDRIVDETFTISYLKNRFGEEKINKYYKIKESIKTEIYCNNPNLNKEVSKFMKFYLSERTIYDKLKLLCEYGLSKEAIEIILGQIPDSDEIKSYYLNLGSDRLKSLGYNVTRIRRELGIVTFSPELLVNEIYSNFKEGDKYTLVDLKQKLSNIYSSINYSATPKATDIDNWFQTRVCQMSIIVDNKRKRVNCLELLTSKEQELRQELKHTN